MSEEREDRKEELKKALGIRGEDSEEEVGKKLKLTKPKVTKWLWVLLGAFAFFLILQYVVRGCVQ